MLTGSRYKVGGYRGRSPFAATRPSSLWRVPSTSRMTAVDYPPIRWPVSPRIVVDGPYHLGLWCYIAVRSRRRAKGSRSRR